MQQMHWILVVTTLVMNVSNEIMGLMGVIPSGPALLYNMTADAVDNVPAVADALSHLSCTPTVCVVFDEGMDTPYCVRRVATIRDMAYVMGELADFSTPKQYMTPQLRRRTAVYLHTFTSNVDIWEIGNEINDEWTGPTREVIDKTMTAYEIIKVDGGRTVLMLHYNEGCAEQSSRAMFNWTQRNVSLHLRDGLDYVFISFHENGYKITPSDRNAVFACPEELFPHVMLDSGKVGTRHTMRKATLVAHYYGLVIAHPQSIGGYFWWYLRQDMVPHPRPLWRSLDTVFLSMSAVVNRQPARSHTKC